MQIIKTKLSGMAIALVLLPMVLLAITLQTTAQSSAGLKSLNIEYMVSMNSTKLGNAVLGRVVTVLNKSASDYTVNSIAKAQGMGAILLGSNIQETCAFELIDNRAQASLCSGGGIQNDTFAVNYDWQNNKLNFIDNSSLDMPSGYVINITMLPFIAALDKGKHNRDEVLYVVDAKNQRIRGFNHVSTNVETITTAIGKISTQKVVYARDIKPERTITFWLSPQHEYVPLKMEEFRKSRVTTFDVVNVNIGSAN